MAGPLFVYGTLCDADVRRHVLGAGAGGISPSPAIAPDHRVVAWPPRTYPAIAAAPGSAAPGLLLADLTTADLDRLDVFEGAEYIRRQIEIIVSGKTARADVYWPALPLPPSAPTWNLDDWRLRHKAAFLAAEAGRHA
jgi:hypothetical protein